MSVTRHTRQNGSPIVTVQIGGEPVATPERTAVDRRLTGLRRLSGCLVVEHASAGQLIVVCAEWRTWAVFGLRRRSEYLWSPVRYPLSTYEAIWPALCRLADGSTELDQALARDVALTLAPGPWRPFPIVQPGERLPRWGSLTIAARAVMRRVGGTGRK